MASEILGEAPCTLFIARDLNRILAGRFFDVCIVENFAIQSIIIASFWPGSLTLSTWSSLIMRLIDLPSQILEIIRPCKLCHGMLLLL